MLLLRLLLSLFLIDRCWSLYEIVWEQCDAGSRLCYVDSDCAPSLSNSSGMLKQLVNVDDLSTDPTDPSRKACNIGIQTRTYSDSKLLVIIQVIGQGSVSDNSPELALYQGEQLLAGCRRTKEGFDILGQDKSRSLALYKDAIHFNDNHMVCAFTIYRPAEFTKLAKEQLVTNVRFSVGSGSRTSKIPFNKKGKFVFQMSQSVTCNPDDIIMQRSIEDHHVVPIKDINRDVIDCANQDTSLGYTLMYTDVNVISTEIKSVSCVPLDESAGTLEYAWHIIQKTNMAPMVIDDPQLFAFACATKISKMCTNPLKCSGNDCPVFKGGTESDDAKIICPGGKWIIDGDYHEGIQPVCKAEMTKMNTANFYMNLGESEVDFTDGKCYTNYDCDLKSHLEFSNCDKEEDGCVVLVKDSKQIHCENGKNVSVQVRQENKTMSAARFNCDALTGQWKDGSGEPIPEFSLVLCEAVVKTEQEPEFNYMDLVYPIVGVLAALLILMIIGYFVITKCLESRKRRRVNRLLNPKIWNKMKPRNRAALVEEILAMICSGDFQYATILHGIRAVDMMLETEEENPQAWEAVQFFLWRLRSCVQNYDQAIYEQLGRYLFLRAKRIIDKYGWVSETPVTKSSLRGYIITVAVQLLGNAMYSSATKEDAENLIMEGFRQLRYAGDSAYPQCGVLWSLITQMPMTKWRSKDRVTSGNMRKLTQEFEDMLSKSEMKDEDVIPQHGSVGQQGWTAVACSFRTCCDDSLLNTYMEDYKEPYFLYGLLHNLFYPDTTAEVLHSWAPVAVTEETTGEILRWEPNDAFVKCKTKFKEQKIYAIMEKMMKAQAYNMKLIDARLLEVLKCFPEKKPASKYYDQLSVELWVFRTTFEESARSISKWLTTAIKSLEQRQPEPEATRADRPLTQLLTTTHDGLPEIGKENEYVMEPMPIRQKECSASPEMQALCHKLLEQLFSKPSFCGVRLEYQPSEILDIVLEVRKVLATDPILIEDVPLDTYVVADLHGQFHDLYRYLTSVNSLDEIPGLKGGRRFVFMGDYVDRGRQSLEVIITLFILKILYPDKFFLLRGNHEDIEVNSTGGFLKELMWRFGESHGSALCRQFLISFGYLSFAAIVGDKVLCVHGGAPGRPVNRHYFRKISKPVYSTGQYRTLYDMVWSDPAIGLTGTCYNQDRSTSIHFSESMLDFFLKSMGCTVLARGHQVMDPGYSIIWNRIISLFSSASEVHEDKPNGAAILHVTAQGELEILESLPNETRRDLLSATEGDAVKAYDKKNKHKNKGETGEVTVVEE